jgi:hypothetical protein
MKDKKTFRAKGIRKLESDREKFMKEKEDE